MPSCADMDSPKELEVMIARPVASISLAMTPGRIMGKHTCVAK